MIEKTVTIPMGPQHPSLKEPACFSITLEGEKVIKAGVGIGYNHRGLEKACEGRTYIQDLYLIERICGICSHTHSLAFCQSVEELLGVEIPSRAAYIRVILAELERLHSHLLWLGVAGHEIGFDSLLMYTWRDRERVLDVLATIGGNRVNYGVNTIGGVRRDINHEEIALIKSMLDFLTDEIKYFEEVVMTDTTLAARMSGIGQLSQADARKLGAVGPVARASGLADDVRAIDPYAAYGDIPFETVTDDHCDILGRAIVRVKEMLVSIDILRYAIENLPDSTLAVRVPRKVPAGVSFARTEAPRGENTHYIRSNGTDKPDRAHFRAPSEANWHCMAHMLEGDFLADVPIIIASIDPCYSCTDRAIVLQDIHSGSQKVMDWNGLRRYSIAFYQQRGFDGAKLRLRKQE